MIRLKSLSFPVTLTPAISLVIRLWILAFLYNPPRVCLLDGNNALQKYYLNKNLALFEINILSCFTQKFKLAAKKMVGEHFLKKWADDFEHPSRPKIW